jgi:chromatin remodeling complex protein RSC6
MCDFLQLPEGSSVSRTTVTRSLIQYIKDHKLQDQTNKKQIQPDETLYKLFGEAAREKTLTYFTMQKYVNHHFEKIA